MINEQGEVACIFEYNKITDTIELISYAKGPEEGFNSGALRNAYLSQAMKDADIEDNERDKIENYFLGAYRGKCDEKTDKKALETYASKKYKPAALKVRPVYAELPDEFRIKRDIKGDPLAEMPVLNPRPPDFKPTGRYTQERMEKMDKAHKGDFLWPEERKLVHHLMMEQNEAFAWEDDERGSFKEEYFPPVLMPTVEHTPWVQKNIPIPPGLFGEVCGVIRQKIDVGVYEASNASYRSRWFCVVKKDGKSLRLVHSLEPLNAVTIAHSGVPPATEELAQHFAGRACGGMFDLFVGYDERLLDERSRDLTTFQTPFGALRLVTLPMGWTNSVPIFHEDVTYILQPEIPEYTQPYLDDVPTRGPATRYEDENGKEETILENSGIRRCVWELMNTNNRILQRMKYCGGTFSGKKSVLCSDVIEVVGHGCSYKGRIPTEDRVGAIMRWTVIENVSQARSFLGTAGVLRAYIPNYAKRAHAIQKLVQHKVPFEWGPEQEESMRLVKEGVQQAKALRRIEYESDGNVVLAVDSSYIGIGYYIYQEDKNDTKIHHYAKFGSITMSEREARYSQPKRELFGLKRALDVNRKLLIGVRKLIVETDAKYIKGMLENPDMMPNATLNRWIDQISLFHFVLKHKAGATFGPDGLSRRARQPTDPEPEPYSDDDEPAWGPPEVIIADPSETQPLPIEEFVDEIDYRGGYFQGSALDIDDFKEELARLDAARNTELEHVETSLKAENMLGAHKVFVQQLINALSLPKDMEEDSDYDESMRSSTAKNQDNKINLIRKCLEDKTMIPAGIEEKELLQFKRLCNRFVMFKRRLYRRSKDSNHRLYVEKPKRNYMIKSAHDHGGHRGFFATRSALVQRFWWPEMEVDIKQFVKTCQSCQERQLQLIKIPPRVTQTPSIFQVLHADVMHMTPASNGCNLIVHGLDNLSSWAEARALKNQKARTIALWLYEDVLCRWGSLQTIVTDNGGNFVAAVDWLIEKYQIADIKISAYNSQANAKIERPHFDLRQMLYKATGGNNLKQWFWFLHAVLWADRCSVRKRTGYSPYYMATGAHPILPIDVKEATWLVKPPTGIMTDEEMIAARARALVKHRLHLDKMKDRIDAAKLKELRRYEEDNKAVIKDYKFEPGDLVLVRNTSIEKSLDSKMKPRYLGPMIVIKRSSGGSYIVAEMTGALWRHKIGAFRVVPYFAREHLEIPDEIRKIIKDNQSTLEDIEQLPVDDELTLRNEDYLTGNMNLNDSDDD